MKRHMHDAAHISTFENSNMATINSIPGIHEFLADMIIQHRKSYEFVSSELKRLNPNVRGLSARSIRRFCKENDIHVTDRMTDDQIDCVVSTCVSKVGPTYGRKLMTGYLSSQGFHCAQKRVGASLQRVRPGYHVRRQHGTARQINPCLYRAEYFGEKLHIDQNEKLVMFGLTHICAIDGYSGKIVGHLIIPVKNNALIYQHLYKEIIKKFGIWDQIRVDHGREWFLMLFINQGLAHMRNNVEKLPHLQTSSKKNYTIERLWVEVNNRINYPIKDVLCSMMNNNDISLDNQEHLYCISNFIINVANIGAELFVSSWNEHTIPGKRRGLMERGVPNILMLRNNRVKRIDEQIVPDVSEAVEMYRRDGGHLSDPEMFGVDSLAGQLEKIEIRETSFKERFSYRTIFYSLVNNSKDQFKNGLLYYIDITHRLSSVI